MTNEELNKSIDKMIDKIFEESPLEEHQARLDLYETQYERQVIRFAKQKKETDIALKSLERAIEDLKETIKLTMNKYNNKG